MFKARNIAGIALATLIMIPLSGCGLSRSAPDDPDSQRLGVLGYTPLGHHLVAAENQQQQIEMLMTRQQQQIAAQKQEIGSLKDTAQQNTQARQQAQERLSKQQEELSKTQAELDEARRQLVNERTHRLDDEGKLTSSGGIRGGGVIELDDETAAR